MRVYLVAHQPASANEMNSVMKLKITCSSGKAWIAYRAGSQENQSAYFVGQVFKIGKTEHTCISAQIICAA